MMKKKLLAIFLAGAAAPAWAQEVPPDDGAVDEIVVTASRRSESIQDISTAVTAFTSESLAASGISNTVDLQTRTPGLVFSTNGSFGQPYVRGVGSDQITPGFDAPVATYIDGAYQARPTASVVDFFDVERVEVLKGPQGALYGRNATGGAISIITRQPGDAFEVIGRGIYGNYDRIQLQGAVNVPVGERVAVRVAGIFNKRDGYSRNLLNGAGLDGEDAWAVRGAIRFSPTETLTVTLGGEYVHEDSTRNNANKIIIAPGLPNPFLARDANGQVFVNLPPFLDPFPPGTTSEQLVPADPRALYNDFPPTLFLEQQRYSLRLAWELGFADLEAVTAYSKVDNTGDFDLDGTSASFAYDRESDFSRTWTQTLQLASSGAGPLRWIVGADYFDERATQNFDARLFAYLFPAGTPILGPSSPITGLVWDSALDSSAWSVYADLKYDLTETLRLVASGRYNEDRKSAVFSQTIIDPMAILGVGATIVIPAEPRLKAGRFTPRFGVELRPADGVLLYATATNGFKSGGFNLLNVGEEFGPEKVWSYEAGIKADVLDRRLRVNLTGFYYDYADLQVLRFSGLSNFVSNADARIYGAELELLARPVAALTLDGSIAFLHARFRDYVTEDSNNPGPIVNLRGNVMPRAPDWTFAAGAQYAVPVADGELTLRGEMRAVSDINFDQFETPSLRQDGYVLVNGRLAYIARDGAWSVALWGRNLLDKTYFQSMVRVDQFFGTIANYGAPRTYGVEVGFAF
ncbi:MAG: TonB-dependent receptor [Sphingomonas sp.]